jgi:8-oxo-dGTP pyrophosphatase MutT (NUDIX family)
MVQRGPGARVMADAWVFPGGIVDEIDGAALAREAVAGEFDDGDLPWVAAAMRETVEEVDIWLTSPPVLSPDGSRRRGEAVFRSALDLGTRFDGGLLAYFANWVTPTMIPLRFDTRFYAAEAGAHGVPAPDPSELAAAEWIAPRMALAEAEATERLVPFPTRKILALIGRFSQVMGFMEHLEQMGEVVPVRARGRVREDGTIATILPGEPDFEVLGDLPPGAVAVADAAGDALAKGHLETPTGL